MLVMERTDVVALESVALLFAKIETVEIPAPAILCDQNVGIDDKDAESPAVIGERTEFDAADTHPSDDEKKYHDYKVEDVKNDQMTFARRRRSISLTEPEPEEEEPFPVRQRTHPRRRRSERRCTILSGLNLLLPRNDLEYEHNTDTALEKGNAHTEQVCSETMNDFTNSEEISAMNIEGTANNNDKEDERIILETVTNGDLIRNSAVTSGCDTYNRVENNAINIGDTSSCTSVILGVGETCSVSRDGESTTVDDKGSEDPTISPSPRELESVSSSSPPPLPQGSPPDASLLRQDPFIIMGSIDQQCPTLETRTEGSANFADQLISALSLAAGKGAKDNSYDSETSTEPSTNLVSQKLQPDSWPDSPRGEQELSTLSSSSSLFSGLFEMPDTASQSLRNKPDRMNNIDTRLSQSEVCLLQHSGSTQIRARGWGSNTIGQTASKSVLAADTEDTPQIRELDSSADRVESTKGMKLAFSTSCLSDTTIDNEFLYFIQRQVKLNAPGEAGDVVEDLDFMSPAERNQFEEFCENFDDEQPEELSSYLGFQNNEDPIQGLINHLLSKPLKENANENSTGFIDCHASSNESLEHGPHLNTSADFEGMSSLTETSRLDSMLRIVPSALLVQRPRSFVRMTSLTEDEVDDSTPQNVSDERDTRAKKDSLTLQLTSSTKAFAGASAPPLPPKSSSFRHARESLKYEFSERRGRSLNLEDDASNSPPPLPPRRGGSLVISGTAAMMHRLPPSLLATRMTSIAGTPNSDNTQTLPLLRAAKRPRQLRDRNCISSIIPDEIPSPIEKSNLSDPNLSSTTLFSPDPPELPPRNGHFLSLEHSHPMQVPDHSFQEPPPRPPPFLRSMSTREGALEKAATFVITSQDYRFSGRSYAKKNYGDQLADKEWIEARNDMIEVQFITSSSASSTPPPDPCTEPPLQHFPVKLDGTHHRLSIVSNSSSDCHQPFQLHSNGAFRFTGDEKLELTEARSDANSIKQMLLQRQKSSSSSDTDFSRKFTSASRTSSMNTSGRRREKFLAGLKGEGSAASSVNLLSNEAPVPCDSTSQLAAASFYDLSVDNPAFVRERQDSTASSAYDDQSAEGVSQASRSRRIAKRLSEVYSAVNWPSRKKEDKKSAKTKDVPFRGMMTRLSFLRDTGSRGVPSDLNTLMDSALSLNEFEIYNEGINLDQRSKREKEVHPKQLSRASLGEDILRRCDLVPPELSSARYSVGSADQMILAIAGDVDDGSKQEANNNRNQKNSERIVLALANLKRDMKEYTSVLECLQNTYEEMRSKTPDGIRQRFDLAFKEVKVMHQLQLELNSSIIKDDVDLSVVAEAFKTKDFSTYKRYSILARDLQKEIKSHSSYFSENFQQFSSNIMKPFHRLNTYSQYLQSFQNNYLDETESKLQEAVAYLNNLKQEANTEMNICDMQKCPVELRLAGLISYSGHLHYDGELFPKQVYVMLFESILVICEDNHDFRVYKQHYRSEQVADVKEAGDMDIEIKVHPTYQSDTIQLKFKANLASERKTWITRLQAWNERNLPSFKTIILNSDLQRNIHRKHDRFLPLSLWMLSPSLKATVDAVKHNRFDEKTIKLNKIHNISRPNSGEDAIFNSFMVNVEDFVTRLDVLLDQEARAPPQLLGSILRKLRRFYKSVFLPQLRADFEKQPERILKSIVGNLPNFPPLFREYIEVRSGLTLVMEDGLNFNQYISPFKHLSFFIEWLFTLSCIAKYHVKLRGQLAILVNCVEDARVTLLHSAIVNCQLDFYKTGDIVRNGNLESKAKCRAIKGNQDYHVILFEKAILFTRAKIPQYEYVQILWLDQVTFGPQPDHKCSFRLEERAAKKIYLYELKAKDEQQKKEWQYGIHKQLHRQVEFVKKNLS